jgi:hypothetical protein
MNFLEMDQSIISNFFLTKEEDDSALQVTMGALTAALDEQSNRKTDLVADTKDAAVRT